MVRSFILCLFAVLFIALGNAETSDAACRGFRPLQRAGTFLKAAANRVRHPFNGRFSRGCN